MQLALVRGWQPGAIAFGDNPDACVAEIATACFRDEIKAEACNKYCKALSADPNALADRLEAR